MLLGRPMNAVTKLLTHCRKHKSNYKVYEYEPKLVPSSLYKTFNGANKRELYSLTFPLDGLFVKQ